MTLKQLQAFYWAAMLGTFAIAADRLHVTQSSLSKRIAELEQDLGQILFDRSARHAALTPYGQALLPSVKRMLDLAEQIREGVDEHTVLVGDLRLGISELSATTWLPDLVVHVANTHPALKLKPRVGIAKALAREVELGSLDCAVITGTPSNPALEFLTVADVGFTWMASPQRIKRGTLVNAKLFETHPLIASPIDSGLSDALHSWAARGTSQWTEVLTCNSLNAILNMTVAGLGISFVPKKYADPLVKRGLLVSLPSEPALPKLQYYFVWRKDDARRLVSEMHAMVARTVNFERSNPLWSA